MRRWRFPLVVVAALLALPATALIAFSFVGPAPLPPVPSAPPPVELPPIPKPAPTKDEDGFRLVEGTVRDGAGAPVAGATVTMEGVQQSAKTARDGSFRLRGVPVTAITISADAPGFLPGTVRVEPGQAGDVTEVEVTLGGALEVAGRVLLPRGVPAVKALIVCGDAAHEGTKTYTDARGEFSLTPEALGCVASAHKSYYESSEEITLSAGSGNELVLRPPMTIRGVVIDDRGDPIPQARVAVKRWVRDGRQGKLSRRARASQNGDFELIKLPSGTYTLVANAPGFQRGTSSPIEVEPEQSVDGVEIVLASSP